MRHKFRVFNSRSSAVNYLILSAISAIRVCLLMFHVEILKPSSVYMCRQFSNVAFVLKRIDTACSSICKHEIFRTSVFLSTQLPKAQDFGKTCISLHRKKRNYGLLALAAKLSADKKNQGCHALKNILKYFFVKTACRLLQD